MDRPPVVVAAGVILDAERRRVLLSFRRAEQDQGGLWEYPGGKVDGDETPLEALRRELLEELAIEPLRCHPLTVIEHDYGGKRVELHFFVVEAHRGSARAMEGQEIAWREVADLPAIAFPAANQPVAGVLSRWLRDRGTGGVGA